MSWLSTIFMHFFGTSYSIWTLCFRHFYSCLWNQWIACIRKVHGFLWCWKFVYKHTLGGVCQPSGWLQLQGKPWSPAKKNWTQKSFLILPLLKHISCLRVSLFDQIDGVAMGLSLVLANLFMGHHERIWLESYKASTILFYRCKYYWRYFLFDWPHQQQISQHTFHHGKRDG